MYKIYAREKHPTETGKNNPNVAILMLEGRAKRRYKGDIFSSLRMKEIVKYIHESGLYNTFLERFEVFYV